ncbi:aminodeoxychorismate synthase component I [Marinicella sp. S1101]|uniref:aminodeoxychorismate synthase component I n=1 Tax=Marinicella marina TaxID=2996016 RepID=UPI002260D16B|nr:aminodeoxychorismate synthase component I [Marinicella marina]MCX7555030.1 aminodeoxychorismate synthase component I [Marinicella marina]MDJ1141306.1 aminodeoxychorismate synthase component I [Marinicella marina]
MINRKLTTKPDLLALTASQPGFFPALLESQSLNEKIGRYDILFAAPSIELVAYDGPQLQQLLATIDTAFSTNNNENPFQYGWYVYFSYESAYYLDQKLAGLAPSETHEPLAVAIYCQGSLVIDHFKQEQHLFADSETVADAIEMAMAGELRPLDQRLYLDEVAEAPGKDFEQAVTYAKALIVSGDIYQANLSRQYQAHIANVHVPADLYAQLRLANPAPFAGMLQIGDFAIISSSPERLFNVKDLRIETRPIAGTRPRGVDDAADKQLIEELLKTPKERAEHIMLIDLERNDLGRVCETGSVEVDELMVVETYEHVHHIVSNVKGQLPPGQRFIEVLKALFPGGTITGCPKIRCMEVIHEIEQRDRGAYTGSMGYINHDGQVDLNILIRTITAHDDTLTFSAGAGIVFDSDPAAELAETRHKAKGMIHALLGDSDQQLGNN